MTTKTTLYETTFGKLEESMLFRFENSIYGKRFRKVRNGCYYENEGDIWTRVEPMYPVFVTAAYHKRLTNPE